MCSNKLLDVKVTVDVVEEPISLEEAKAYMDVDYDEKNTIISQLIVSARQILEEKYDIGIALKTLQVIIDNSCGGFELPGAPIGSVSAVDRSGNPVEVEMIGEFYKYVESPCSCYLKLTYTSGFSEPSGIPYAIRNAVKQQVLWMLEHLGDEAEMSGVSPMAAASLQPYRRNGTGLFI